MLRFSTGLRNFIAKYGSIADALQNGCIEIYTGGQPSTPDAAPTGTLLCTISNAGNGYGGESQATGTVSLTAGTAGSVSSITVNGVEVMGATINYDTSLSQTATDIAAQINTFESFPDYYAVANGPSVTIYAMPGVAAAANGYAVVATASGGITATTTAMSGGVPATNGLKLGAPAAGSIPQQTNQVWSGTNGASGTAGWFRQYGGIADNHQTDSLGIALRMDGAIGTAGAEMNLSNTSFASGAVTTLAAWLMTVPGQ